MNTGEVITIRCPKCGKTVKVKADAAGKKVRCPRQDCATTINIPGPAQSEFGIKGQTMTSVGVFFAVIAAVLIIRYLELELGWIVSAVLVGLVVISELLKGDLKAGALVLFALLGLSTPAFFFILQGDSGELAFYVGTGLFFGLSSYLIFRAYRTWGQFDLSNPAKRAINLESSIVWFALNVSSMAFSWATYYKFLSRGGAPDVRRLAITLFFVVVGVVCAVFGRKSAVPFLAVTGLTYMSAGVLKALAYDFWLSPPIVRIGIFASCGAVLLLGGFLMKRPTSPKVEAASDFVAVIED